MSHPPQSSTGGLGGGAPSPQSFLRWAPWLNEDRARSYARVLALLMAAALIFDWVSTAIGHHPRGAVTGPAGKPQATDFLAFWAAGRQALRLGGAAAYDLPPLLALEHSTAILDPSAVLAFVYPPSFLLLCLPFAALPYLAGFAAFVAGQGAALGVALRRILPADWGVLPILAFPGLLMNAATGQNGCWTASCFAWGMVWLERRPGLAGACLGMLVIKPHLALAVPLGLTAARRWRALFACGGTAAAWIGLSWLALGTPAWRGFLASAPIIRSTLEEHHEQLGRLQSAFATARLCGASLMTAYGAQMLLAVCVLGAVAAVLRRHPAHGADVAVLAAASLLCTPYVLDYDLAISGVALAWIARRAACAGWLAYERLGAGLVFVWPLVARMAGSDWRLPLGPIVLLGLFALVCRRAWREVLPC